MGETKDLNKWKDIPCLWTERLDVMKDINPWSFTMGSALFAKDFDKNADFRGNLQIVVDYMNK